MSDVVVEVARIDVVVDHPNADRLSIVTTLGWSCITSRGRFKPGDMCIYLPIDSVMPPTLLARIFGPDAKVYPIGGRIKTIKLRGCISQGLVLAPEEVTDLLPPKYKQGDDVTEELGITKYTKRVKGPSTTLSAKVKKRRIRKILHEKFARYTDINHLQKYSFYLDQVAAKGIDVVAHIKVHGMSARYGWVKRTGFLERIRSFFGLAPRHVFLMGSRNVDMLQGSNGSVHSDLPRNVYEQVATKYGMKERVPKGFSVFGEVIGPGVQPGYHYGVKAGDVRFMVYDVKEADRWLDDMEIQMFCRAFGFKRVLEAYRGPFSLDALEAVVSGPDPIAPKEHPPREGIVVRPVTETTIHGVRLLFKWVNPEFLLSKHAESEIEDNATEEQELTVV
jgi:RNA ligase (TIGR02306 family)